MECVAVECGQEGAAGPSKSQRIGSKRGNRRMVRVRWLFSLRFNVEVSSHFWCATHAEVIDQVSTTISNNPGRNKAQNAHLLLHKLRFLYILQ